MTLDPMRSPDDSSADFTHTSAPHADWIAAARGEAAACVGASGRDTSNPQHFGRATSVEDLRRLLGARYQLGDEIRRGGQGVVYRGVQLGTGRDVAIKVMYHSTSGEPAGRLRFERETRLLAQLHHPNIVAIHDSGGDDSSLYYVMDYILGAPLDEHLRRAGPREIAALFAKVCDGVNVAHLRGIIHRDLKPSNIRVDPAGEPRVLDFGLARFSEFEPLTESRSDVLTETGQFLGSLPWASPEQVAARPDELDLRTDVYSIGVMMYQALTGYPPYPVNGPVRHVLENICQYEPKSPSEASKAVPDDLGQIVLKCLRKRADERYQTAGDVARELRRWLAGEPIEAKRDQTWYMLRKRIRRYRMAAIVASLLGVIVLGSLVAALAFYRQEHRLREEIGVALGRESRERGRAEAALRSEETARRLAEKNAVERTQVAGFQAALLENIDTQAMGQAIREELRSGVRAALARAAGADAGADGTPAAEQLADELAKFDALLSEIQPVDLARRALAQHFLSRVPEMVAARFSEQPQVQAELLLNLGVVLLNLAFFEEAEAPLRRALALVRGAGDAVEQSDRLANEANILSQLGGVLSELGRYAEAAAAHRESHELALRQGAGAERAALRALNNMAAMSVALGQPDEANAVWRSAVEQARRLVPPDDELLAETLHNLGTSLAQRGDFAGAAPLLREAVALTEAALGESHEQVAASLTTLANVLAAAGARAEAEPLLRRALQINCARLGDEHPDVAYTMTGLAGVLRDADPQAARALYEQALAIARGAHTPGHPVIAGTLDKLGTLLRQIGDYDAAESALREALAIRRARDDLRGAVPQSLNNLGRLQLSRGDWAGAAGSYREARAIQRDDPLSNDADRAIVAIGLARALVGLREFDAARAELEAVADDSQIAALPPRPRLFLCEAWVSLHGALHALEPEAGHDARAAQWQARIDSLLGSAARP